MARRCFLTVFLFFYHSVTVQSVIYGLKGQQVQFDPDITGQPKQILWIYNDIIIVEFNGIKDQVSDSYKGRVTLIRHSAQLQISDLHLEDSGKYIYEISIGGKTFHQSYELEVIEKVAKPTITCLNSDSSSTVSAVLLCSVEPNQTQSSLKFEWSSKGNVQYGPQLTIFLGGGRDEEEYTCRVSNPVSNETATFRAKDCSTDAGLSAGTIVVIVLISILIVIACVVLLILLCRRKHKKKKALEQIRNITTNILKDPDAEQLREAAEPSVAMSLIAGPAEESGGVTEDVVSIQNSCSASQHSEKKALQQIRNITKKLTDPDAEQLGEAAEPSVAMSLIVAGPAEESGGVTEDMVSIQNSCSASQHSGSVREGRAEKALKQIYDITDKVLTGSRRFSLIGQNKEKRSDHEKSSVSLPY